MRNSALIGTMLLAVALPVAAQEIAIHGSSSRWSSETLRHGLGISLGGSVRLGDLLVDSSLARRANLRIGLRASITDSRFKERNVGWLCVDDCAADANHVAVSARTTQITLNLLPYVSSRTRVEINGGIAFYRTDNTAVVFGNSWRDSQHGFVSGASMARRFGDTPTWLQIAYTRHAEVLQPADGGFDIPRHSFVVGLMFRFADR